MVHSVSSLRLVVLDTTDELWPAVSIRTVTEISPRGPRISEIVVHVLRVMPLHGVQSALYHVCQTKKSQRKFASPCPSQRISACCTCLEPVLRRIRTASGSQVDRDQASTCTCTTVPAINPWESYTAFVYT